MLADRAEDGQILTALPTSHNEYCARGVRDYPYHYATDPLSSCCGPAAREAPGDGDSTSQDMTVTPSSPIHGALDEIVRDHLNEQLLELWDRTNKTICFVTHSIPEAVYLSTKIVVMSPRPGRVTDVIESTLPKERPLDIREAPEFLAIAARVRDGLRAGHSYED